MTDTVLQLTVRTVSRDLVQQDALWDHLVEWCDLRSLFIGGSLASAVIYSPLQPVTGLRRRQLLEWLSHRPEIQTHRLEVNALRDLRSSRVKAACLEAFSQAQRYLAERMAECSDAMAGLEPPMSRRWKATVSEGERFLELESRYLNISVAISRLDHEPASQFQAFAGRYLELDDLKALELDWVGLAWARVLSDGDLSIGQWVIESRHWRIHLYAHTTAQLTHREVMLRWMEAVCAS